jgi:hypothetical protein
MYLALYFYGTPCASPLRRVAPSPVRRPTLAPRIKSPDFHTLGKGRVGVQAFPLKFVSILCKLPVTFPCFFIYRPESPCEVCFKSQAPEPT